MQVKSHHPLKLKAFDVTVCTLFYSLSSTKMASEKLIHLVFQNKALFGKLCKVYRDAEFKDQLWHIIAEQLSIGDGR